MSGLRFKAGEMAIVAVSFASPSAEGAVIEIERIQHWPANPPKRNVACDYTTHVNGKWVALADWQLRKIDPPAEPASLTRNEECEVTA